MSTEPGEPTKEAAFFTAIRSWGIVRGDQRVFGGVLSGVGARIGLAPAPARIIFVVLTIVIGGPLLVAYAAAWALLPDTEGRIIIQDFGRGTPNVGALVAIGIMTFIGIGAFGNPGWHRWWNLGVWDLQFGDSPGPSWFVGMLLFLIPVAVIGGIVWVIIWSVRQGREPARAAQGYARMPDGTVPQSPGAGSVPADEAGEPATTPDGGAVPAMVAASSTAAAAPVPPLDTPSAYTAPPYTPPVYQAPAKPYTPKPRVPGPGKVGYLLALAMIPVAIAITLYLHTSDQLNANPVLVAGVIWVAGLGLILVINALRGRKAGFLGFLSFVALLPVGLSIAFADEISEHYGDDNSWGWTWVDDGSYNGWSWGDPNPEPSVMVEPTHAPEPAFDPSGEFLDYESVAINGTCYPDMDAVAPEVSGTVRLSAVSADQTITVTSADTLLSIPEGTSLKIINMGGNDGMASAFVAWDDRDLACDLVSVGSPAIQLTNPDAPVLTVLLDDTMTMGYMTLWIEEN